MHPDLICQGGIDPFGDSTHISRLDALSGDTVVYEGRLVCPQCLCWGGAASHLARHGYDYLLAVRRPYRSLLVAGVLGVVGSVFPRGRLDRQLHGARYAPGSPCSLKATHRLCRCSPQNGLRIGLLLPVSTSLAGCIELLERSKLMTQSTSMSNTSEEPAQFVKNINQENMLKKCSLQLSFDRCVAWRMLHP